MVLRQRKRLRIKGFDYSSNNYYFVTICTYKRMRFFGKVEDGKMILNPLGEIIQKKWLDLPNHYFNCFLDEFVIMPNHFHGIILIDNGDILCGGNSDMPGLRNGLKPFREEPGMRMKPFREEPGMKPGYEGAEDISVQKRRVHGLSEMIRAFKTFSSKEINIFWEESLGANENNFEKDLFIELGRFKWHKSFHERIIRDERQLNNVRNYIKNNPLKWHLDIENYRRRPDDSRYSEYYNKIIPSEEI